MLAQRASVPLCRIELNFKCTIDEEGFKMNLCFESNSYVLAICEDEVALENFTNEITELPLHVPTKNECLSCSIVKKTLFSVTF